MEDDMHPFIFCWWSRAVWFYLGMNVHIECKNLRSLTDLIYYAYAVYDSESFCKVLVALWFIWHHRNQVCHGSASISPVTASLRINQLYKDFTRNNKSLLPNINTISLKWQPPIGNFVKISCDDAWSEEYKTGGVEVIARDSKGCVVGIALRFLHHSNSVVQCEGITLMEGVIMARNLHLENVIFETDNMHLVMVLNFGENNEVSRAHWFRDITEILLANRNWHIVFARREANVVADFLARKAHVESWNWHRLDVIPFLDFLVQLL